MNLPDDAEQTPEVLPDPALTRAIARYADEPAEVIAGNTARLLRDGKEAFPRWLAAIAAAKQRISMEMYIFSDDSIGRQFRDALVLAAQRGVAVRLLYDFIGCRDTPAAFFDDMRRQGVRTIPYHRVHGWRPRFWKLFRRNHRKTLVVDGSVAFTGGLNISDAWLPAADGGQDLVDAAIEVSGPAAAAIENAFARTWNRRARKRYRLLIPPPSDTVQGRVPLAVIANTELRDRFTIRRAALHAMRAASRRLWIANPYFIPDRGILHALSAAALRGVDVRVLVSQNTDSRVVDLAVSAHFAYLLRAGIRVFRHPRFMHAKLLMIDDTFLSIGSYNMDHRSLSYNLEMVVNAFHVETVNHAAAILESEMAVSTEENREHFRRRGWVTRILERLAYTMRRWL